MRTWYNYNRKEDKNEDKKQNSAKLALISKFCKQ